jgi:DNA-binding transcriptional LysR family regulator
MELRQIRYALSVAKERSFTRAAARLRIAQSAVSEQVRLLEDEIGFPLFRRTGRGIEVTERGRTFLAEAERVVGDVLSLSDTARRLKGAPADTLRLGMGSGMAQIFVPRLFRLLAETRPGLRLELVTAPTKSIFSDLHEERIDVGIALESDPDRVPAGLVVERLTEAEMALILHPKHPLAASRRAIDIGRLVAEPIIMSELTVGYGDVVMAMFTDLGMKPNILAVADNIETMKVIVQSGTGLAIVPRASAEQEVASGVLRLLPLSPRRAVVLSLFRRRQPMSRHKEGFVAQLRAALRD